jgi:hypothetical protein
MAGMERPGNEANVQIRVDRLGKIKRVEILVNKLAEY